MTQAAVAELFKALELKGERKAEVERAMALARQAYANNALVVQRASRLLGVAAIDNAGNAGNGVAAGLAGYAQLVSLQQALSIEVANYERELRGLDESHLLQAATLPIRDYLAEAVSGYAPTGEIVDWVEMQQRSNTPDALRVA